MDEKLIKPKSAFRLTEYSIAKIFNIAPWRQKSATYSYGLVTCHLLLLVLCITLVIFESYQAGSYYRSAGAVGCNYFAPTQCSSDCANIYLAIDSDLVFENCYLSTANTTTASIQLAISNYLSINTTSMARFQYPPTNRLDCGYSTATIKVVFNPSSGLSPGTLVFDLYDPASTAFISTLSSRRVLSSIQTIHLNLPLIHTRSTEGLNAKFLWVYEVAYSIHGQSNAVVTVHQDIAEVCDASNVLETISINGSYKTKYLFTVLYVLRSTVLAFALAFLAIFYLEMRDAMSLFSYARSKLRVSVMDGGLSSRVRPFSGRPRLLGPKLLYGREDGVSVAGQSLTGGLFPIDESLVDAAEGEASLNGGQAEDSAGSHDGDDVEYSPYNDNVWTSSADVATARRRKDTSRQLDGDASRNHSKQRSDADGRSSSYRSSTFPSNSGSRRVTSSLFQDYNVELEGEAAEDILKRHESVVPSWEKTDVWVKIRLLDGWRMITAAGAVLVIIYAIVALGFLNHGNSYSEANSIMLAVAVALFLVALLGYMRYSSQFTTAALVMGGAVFKVQTVLISALPTIAAFVVLGIVVFGSDPLQFFDTLPKTLITLFSVMNSDSIWDSLQTSAPFNSGVRGRPNLPDSDAMKSIFIVLFVIMFCYILLRLILAVIEGLYWYVRIYFKSRKKRNQYRRAVYEKLMGSQESESETAAERRSRLKVKPPSEQLFVQLLRVEAAAISAASSSGSATMNAMTKDGVMLDSKVANVGK